LREMGRGMICFYLILAHSVLGKNMMEDMGV